MDTWISDKPTLWASEKVKIPSYGHKSSETDRKDMDGGDILNTGGWMFMARNEFSPEEVKILNKNPYTLKATSKRIMFTLEGKKKILALYEEGKAITQILREMGYDPDMLGHHRTKGIIGKLKEQADSKYGLHNGYARRTPKRMTAEQIAELQENPESYAKLKNEVIYLREEVEFLKKVSQQVISGKRGK